MKKTILALLTLSMIAMLTACGSSNESKNDETIAEDEKESSEESAEALEEVEDVKEEEGENESSADEEWVSEKYISMNFSYPSGSEYSEEDGYALITIVPTEKIMFIYSREMSKEDADLYLPAANLSILSAFENVTNTESYDLTIDGLEAVGETGEGDFNGWHLNCELASVYDEHSGYLYTIEYTSTTDTDEDANLYDTFIDSVSFD